MHGKSTLASAMFETIDRDSSTQSREAASVRRSILEKKGNGFSELAEVALFGVQQRIDAVSQ
jgi:hypothetical protein